jgi:dolichol-phosphate mannosyltransferase
MRSSVLIFIPTYNEKENVAEILNQILALNISADILFVDDNSPDGTGQVLDDIAKNHTNVFVHHRAKKLGIGSAHRYGIRWAFSNGYQRLVTMDCDFTHSPEYISAFIEKSEIAAIVVGNRYMEANSLKTWNAYRRFLTRLGHWATSFFLNMPYDATGAFRVYRLDHISPYFLDAVHSNGYSFFFESLFILNVNGYKIAEVATQLPARVYGHSKMRLGDALNSISQLVHLFLTRLVNRERFEISEPFSAASATGPKLIDPQGWDEYWTVKEGKASHLVYDLIAAFYRKFIIRPSLNHFILKNFGADARLVHAGCGSGQVDKDIGEKIGISALDISPAALSIYKKSNKHYRELIHGSIFDIPLEQSSVDGVYNLGVMEHFSEEEIQKILAEFQRILKPGGKIILFWPPKFGLSVMFLKTVHYVLNRILGKNVMLHPAEITHMVSRKHAQNFLDRTGFSLTEYSFGIRDLFTHAIIVGEKKV